jgi:hypothetical protein
MQDESYYNIKAISQSSIKDFRKLPPIEWKKIYITGEKAHKNSAALSKGSITDDLLFNPSTVDDKYIIWEVKKPSDSVSFIIENIFDENKTLEDLKEAVIETAKIVPMADDKIGWGQGKGWNDQRILDTVNKEGKDYYDFLKSVNGKHIIPTASYMAALRMAEEIKKNEIASYYLNEKLNKFQVALITDEDFPFKLKGLLDILHINDEKKEMRIVDFKTCDNAYYFIGNVYRFGYLDQVAFYNHLLMMWIEKNMQYAAYTILPPMNIAIDSRYNIPYFYEYGWKDIEKSWHGYIKNGEKRDGLRDTITEIQWHIIEDKWDYPMEHYLNGKITLNLL